MINTDLYSLDDEGKVVESTIIKLLTIKFGSFNESMFKDILIKFQIRLNHEMFIDYKDKPFAHITKHIKNDIIVVNYKFIQ